MKRNLFQKNNFWRRGFSLIEIVVAVGVLGALLSATFLIGLPQYDRYALDFERQSLVDVLLDCRSRALSGADKNGIKIWSDGYCTINGNDSDSSSSTSLCVGEKYDLPTGVLLTSRDGFSQGFFSAQGLFSTSTILTLEFTQASSTLNYQIDLDSDGFIDGR